MKIVLNLIALFIIFSSSVFAETKVATPSSSPTTSPTISTTPSPSSEDIQTKIKNLVQENIANTENTLKEKVNLSIYYGYEGKITSISSGNISLNFENDIIQITTTTNTSILKSNSAIKISSLAISDTILVIGKKTKNGVVQASQISVITPEPDEVLTEAIIAKIISIDTKSKSIVLNVKGKEINYTLSKKTTVKLTDFEPNQTIFAISKLYSGKYSLSRATTI